MTGWRPLSAHGGTVTDCLFDSDGRVVFRSQQTVDPILDMNKVLRNDTHDRGYTPSGEMRRVASIPNIIIHKWLAEDGLDVLSGDQPELLARKLNDPDNAYLRTAPGRIGVSNGVAR